MLKAINWMLNIQTSEGYKISEANKIEVDACDAIGIILKGNAQAEDIEIQPGGSGQVKFLLIQSDCYDPKISYSVNEDKSNDEDRIKLDALQLLMGNGAVKLLGEPPNKLFFYNGLTRDVTLQILVGRKATTP